MTTILPISIDTIADACEFLKSLHDNGEAFHPEDDPATIVGGLFTDEESANLRKLMNQVYKFADEDFDPFGFLLGWDKIDIIRAGEKLNDEYDAAQSKRDFDTMDEVQDKMSIFCDENEIKESLDEWIARYRAMIHPVNYPNYEPKAATNAAFDITAVTFEEFRKDKKVLTDPAEIRKFQREVLDLQDEDIKDATQPIALHVYGGVYYINEYAKGALGYKGYKLKRFSTQLGNQEPDSGTLAIIERKLYEWGQE